MIQCIKRNYTLFFYLSFRSNLYLPNRSLSFCSNLFIISQELKENKAHLYFYRHWIKQYWFAAVFLLVLFLSIADSINAAPNLIFAYQLNGTDFLYKSDKQQDDWRSQLLDYLEPLKNVL